MPTDIKERYAQAQEGLISLDSTPYYHCVNRCVRRAFLCGEDPLSGQSYEHRRQWILEKLVELSRCFAIDCAGYALLSNHYHLVLCVDRENARDWNTKEVIERWQRLFKGPLLAERFMAEQPLSRAERNLLDKLVEEWRGRLVDISWFMRCLNEYVARKANQEDQCSGRFWEGRFKSQALLDEKALAACLAYVDLNPIRAKMAKTPETSQYTSGYERIASLSHTQEETTSNPESKQPENLLPFVGNLRKDMPKGLPFRLTDYLELLDWTGSIIREDKRGHIPQDLPPQSGALTDRSQTLAVHDDSLRKPIQGIDRCCVLLEAGLSESRLSEKSRAFGLQDAADIAKTRYPTSSITKLQLQRLLFVSSQAK